MNNRRFGFRLSCFVIVLLVMVPWNVLAQDSALKLNQTFDNGQSSFRYPEGWVLREVGPLLSLATDESAFETGTDLASGEMRATVVIGPLRSQTYLVNRVDPSIDDLVSYVLSFEVPETCTSFGKPLVKFVGGIIVATMSQICNESDNLTLIADLGDDNVMMILATAVSGEMGNFLPALIDIVTTAVVASVKANPYAINSATFSQNYVPADKTYTISYPENWHILDDEIQGTPVTVLTMSDRFIYDVFPKAGSAYAALRVGSVTEVTGDPASTNKTPALTVLDFLINDPLIQSAKVDGFDYDSFEHNGRLAARFDVNILGHDVTSLVLMLDDGHYVFAHMLAVTGEMPAFSEAVLAIISTTQIATPSAG